MLIEILSLVGAVCLFLYGMRQISDALQKLSGRRMRAVIHKLTNTKLRGFFSGFFLTSLIQTSSASTLLIVSLVNVGVISIVASVPMIIGANVGTTVKLWIISFFGFHFDIGPLALLILAAGFPLLFFKTGKLKNLGEFLIGFSLLFLGLFYMKSVFPDADEHSFFYEWLQSASQSGFSGILIFIFLGFLITAIIQSSSAAITLTFVLCFQGVISFPVAVALVFGQNIGTTVTVNIGALVGDAKAKRAALSHFLMNLITVLLLLPFFQIFTTFSQNAVLFLFQADVNNPQHIPIALSFAHTAFNLILALLMLPATRFIIRLTEVIFPVGKNKKHKLTLLEDNFFSTSELSVIHVKTGIIGFASQVKNSLNYLPVLLIEKKDKKFDKIIDEIQISKQAADRKRSEISDYLSRISERDISSDSSKFIIKLSEINDSIESVSDQVLQFAKTIELKNKSKAWFSQEMRDDLTCAIRMVVDESDIMLENLAGDFEHINIEPAKVKHENSVEFLNKTMKSCTNEKENIEIPQDSVIYFSQMLAFTERISGTIFNISKIITRTSDVHKIQ